MKPILIVSDAAKSSDYARMFMEDGWETYTLPMFSHKVNDFPINQPRYMFIIIPDIHSAYSMRYRLRDMTATSLICIGEDTGKILNKYALRRADVVLSDASMENILEAMERISMAGDTIFLASGNSPVATEIAEFFKNKSVALEAPHVYTQETIQYHHGFVGDYMKVLNIKDVLLLSPLGARSFVDQPGLDVTRYNFHVAGETTASCLSDYNLQLNICLKADPRSVRTSIWNYWKREGLL